jgi:uncharacterized tellurite resistance protein B-like protein
MTEEPIDPRFEGNQLIIETSSETEIYDSQFLVAALLVYVAKGDGVISSQESDRMLQLIGDHFHLRSADSLELLTRAMSSIAENPDLDSLLRQLGTMLSDADKEDVAVMMMKVCAADGKTDVDEMEKMRSAGEMVGISAPVMHSAYDRYFAETSGGL